MAGRLRAKTALAGSSVPQLVIGLAVAAAVAVIGILHFQDVSAGGQSLAGADTEWLVLAGSATVAIWLVCTVTQFGSMPTLIPFRRVFAVQVAAQFLNHLLPAGAGGIAVNVRFLQRHGMKRAAAVGSVGLNSLAGMVTHLILLAGALAISPAMLDNVKSQVPAMGRRVGALGPWLGLAAIVAALALAAFVARRGRERVKSVGARALRELKALAEVLRHPARASALWLGSLTVPLLHSLILYAVLRGVGASIGLVAVAVIYVVVSSLSAAVPAPGGIGALDVMLIAAFIAAGVSSPDAWAAVVGYRLLTVWVPLLPGAMVFALLLRRRII